MGRFVYQSGFESENTVWVDHDGLIRETEKAVLYRIDGEEVWFPKTVIVDHNEEWIGIQGWFAKKNNIEGSYK